MIIFSFIEFYGIAFYKLHLIENDQYYTEYKLIEAYHRFIFPKNFKTRLDMHA